MPTRAETFRDKLQEAAKLRSLDFDGLATKAGFDAYERKWLGRVWTSGLGDQRLRSRKRLKRICNVLGVENVNDLWDERWQPNPESVVSDREQWAELVGQIIWKFQLFTQAKLRQGSMVRAALKRYGFNEAMFIADWMAHDRGLKRLQDVDLQWLKSVISEVGKELRYNNKQYGSIVKYVRERAVSHPKWPQFVKDVEGQGEFEEVLTEIVQSLQYRTITPPEVCEQFIRIYLEGKDRPVAVEFNVVENILNRLRNSPKWPKYIDEVHKGDAIKAEEAVALKWRQAAEESGVTVMPDVFASCFEQLVLARYGEESLDEIGATSMRLRLRLRKRRRRRQG